MSANEDMPRIVSRPDILLGKPIFRGTRIPVYIVLDLLEAGASSAEILEDYPDLVLADVSAAIAFREDQRSRLTTRIL